MNYHTIHYRTGAGNTLAGVFNRLRFCANEIMIEVYSEHCDSLEFGVEDFARMGEAMSLAGDILITM